MTRDGKSNAEVQMRIQVGVNAWRRVEGVIGDWDNTLCRALVLLKQSPWLLGTILDGSPLQHSIPALILPTSEG